MDRNSPDLSEYIGLPYAGCWDLVRDLYLRCFDLVIPDVEHIVDELDDWLLIPVGKQVFGDVLVFREPVGKHVGFCLDRQKMIHTTSKKDNVIESYKTIQWKDRLQSIYRHKSL